MNIEKKIYLPDNPVNINSSIEIRDLRNNGVSFSFNMFNKLPFVIKNIHTLIIKYDDSGSPIDYYEKIYILQFRLVLYNYLIANIYTIFR